MEDTSAFGRRYSCTDTTSESPRDDSVDVDKLLQDKGQRKKLRKLAAELHCEENVAFFDLFYELKAAKTAADRIKYSRKLFEKHVSTGAPMEVNLEHSTRVTMEGLANRLDRGLLADCPVSSWSAVHQEVRNMVVATVIPVYNQRYGMGTNGSRKHGMSPSKKEKLGSSSLVGSKKKISLFK